MNRFSIRGRLVAILLLAISFLSIQAGVNWYSLRESARANEAVQNHFVKPLLRIQEVDSALKEIRFRMAGVLLDQLPTVGSANHLKETREQIPRAWNDFKASVVLSEHGEEERKHIESIDAGLTKLQPYLDKVAAAYAAGDKAVLTSLLEDEWPLFHTKIIKPLGLLVPAFAEDVGRTFTDANARAQRLNLIALVAYLVCVGLLAVLVVPLVRSMAARINGLRKLMLRVAEGDLSVSPDLSGGDELADMAQSLDSTIQGLKQIIGNLQRTAMNLGDAASALGAAVEDQHGRSVGAGEMMGHVTSAVERVTGDAREIASQSEQVAEASGLAQQSAAEGDSRMKESIAATERVSQTVEQSAAVISELARSTDQISQVTQVIRDIADQTNLLALNAAIEAARAGEQGRGFAVVADEVRKLAERTSSSTADIAAIVEAIRAKTNEAVSAMEAARDEVGTGVRYNSETRASLDAIVAAATRVRALASDIARATGAQMNASEETTRSMRSVAEMNDAASVAMNAVETISGRIASVAEELQTVTNRFRI